MIKPMKPLATIASFGNVVRNLTVL